MQPVSTLSNSKGTQVPALDRTVAILDILSNAASPLSLAELTLAISIPKSSSHNLLQALLTHGLVRRNQDGRFTLGTKAMQWGQSLNNGSVVSELMSAFEAAMKNNLSLQTETVMLALLDGTDVTYLACHPGTRPLAVNFKVGGRFVASCTSSGKAILSSLEDADIRALYRGQQDTIYSSGKLYKLTRHSIGSVTALCKAMPDIRLQGFAIDDEETAEGMQCFGAPVWAAANTKAVGGVAVSTIKASLNARRKQEVIAAIKQLAKDISGRLGATT
jgi:IclR family transcriptional regulator, blcABC operon repressor